MRKPRFFHWSVSSLGSFAAWSLFGAALFYLAIRKVNPTEIVQSIASARLVYVILGMLSVGLNVLIKATRWRILIGRAGKGLSFSQILFALVLGQILNWFAPGRLGDLSRIYLIGKAGPGKAHAFATVALEKIIDLVSYSGLFILTALYLFPLPNWINRPGIPLAGIMLGIAAGLSLLSLRNDRWRQAIQRFLIIAPGSLKEFVRGGLHRLFESFHQMRRENNWAMVIFLTIVAWATAGLTNHLAGLALNLDLPAAGSLVLLVALYAGISLPGVPGKIGVFQYICILVLGLFSLDQQTGLSYGILLQALVMLPVTLAGLGYVIWRGASLATIEQFKGFLATKENLG